MNLLLANRMQQVLAERQALINSYMGKDKASQNQQAYESSRVSLIERSLIVYDSCRNSPRCRRSMAISRSTVGTLDTRVRARANGQMKERWAVRAAQATEARGRPS